MNRRKVICKNRPCITYQLKSRGIGEGPGKFIMAHSIYVDKPGAVYVADGKANRVQRFLPINL